MAGARTLEWKAPLMAITASTGKER
jgi:hypothetical protein